MQKNASESRLISTNAENEEHVKTDDERLIDGMLNAFDTILGEELWKNINFFFYHVEVAYKRLVGCANIINSPNHICDAEYCICTPIKVVIIKRTVVDNVFNRAFAAQHGKGLLLLTGKDGNMPHVAASEMDRFAGDDIRNYDIIFPELMEYDPESDEIEMITNQGRLLELHNMYVCRRYGKIHPCGPDRCVLVPKLMSGMTICPLTHNAYGAEIDGEKPYARVCVEDDDENEELKKEQEFEKAVEADGKEKETAETRFLLAKSVVALLLTSDQRQLRESDNLLDAYQKFMEQFNHNCRRQSTSDNNGADMLLSTRLHVLAVTTVRRNSRYFSRFPVNSNIRGHIRERLAKISEILKTKHYSSSKKRPANGLRAVSPSDGFSQAHFDALDRRKNELISEFCRQRPLKSSTMTSIKWKQNMDLAVSWIAKVIVDRWSILEHYNEIDATSRKKKLGLFRYRIVPLLYMFSDGCYIQDPFDKTQNINVIPKVDIAKYLPPTNKIEEYSEFCAIPLRNISFTESFNDLKEFFTTISVHFPELFLSSSSTSTR